MGNIRLLDSSLSFEILYKGQKYEVSGLGRFIEHYIYPFYLYVFTHIKWQWNNPSHFDPNKKPMEYRSRLDIQEIGKEPLTFTEVFIFTVFIQKFKHLLEEKTSRVFLAMQKKRQSYFWAESRGDYKFGLAAGYIGGSS